MQMTFEKCILMNVDLSILKECQPIWTNSFPGSFTGRTVGGSRRVGWVGGRGLEELEMLVYFRAGLFWNVATVPAAHLAYAHRKEKYFQAKM